MWPLLLWLTWFKRVLNEKEKGPVLSQKSFFGGKGV